MLNMNNLVVYIYGYDDYTMKFTNTYAMGEYVLTQDLCCFFVFCLFFFLFNSFCCFVFFLLFRFFIISFPSKTLYGIIIILHIYERHHHMQKKQKICVCNWIVLLLDGDELTREWTVMNSTEISQQTRYSN